MRSQTTRTAHCCECGRTVEICKGHEERDILKHVLKCFSLPRLALLNINRLNVGNND